MDGELLLEMFLGFGLLPIIVGFGASFFIVGKGMRLAWIVPAVALWYGSGWLMGAVMPHKLSLPLLLSGWGSAAIMLVCAWGFRHLRRAPAADAGKPD